MNIRHYLKVTLEESDQENLAELEEADETAAERGDEGIIDFTATATNSDVANNSLNKTGENKPSGSQNQSHHAGM